MWFWEVALFKKILLAAGALSVVSGAAGAEDVWPKWYVGLTGALPFVGDTGVTRSGASLGSLEFDNPGWGVGASIGYKPGGTGGFLDMARFELEYGYRENSLDTLAGATVADDLSVSSYMFNALYDVATGTQFIPYLGAGIGWSRAELNVPAISVSDSDTVFSYQFLAGVAYAPESIPNTAFSLGYRYFATGDVEFGSSLGTVEHEYDSHGAEIGARFSF